MTRKKKKKKNCEYIFHFNYFITTQQVALITIENYASR